MKTSETKIPAAAGNLVRYQTAGTKNTCPADKKNGRIGKITLFVHYGNNRYHKLSKKSSLL